MPYPNEHAARQAPPGKFREFRRDSKGYPDGISVIYGIADGKSQIQSVRFDHKKWTVARARKWLEDHKMKTGIEPATTKEAPAAPFMDVMFKVQKVEQDQHEVYGWLYVTNHPDGTQVVDRSGEFIRTETLERAVTKYMLEQRVGGSVHMRNEDGSVFQAGRIIASMVFTKRMCGALGIPDGVLPQGWFVGYKIDHEPTWEAIKSGTLTCFSIGGRAQRREVIE